MEHGVTLTADTTLALVVATHLYPAVAVVVYPITHHRTVIQMIKLDYGVQHFHQLVNTLLNMVIPL